MAKKKPTKPTSQPPSLKKAAAKGAQRTGVSMSRAGAHPAVIAGSSVIGGAAAGGKYLKDKRRAKKNGKKK